MTRVAALYDVHGNLPALEAVLHELDATSVDAVIFGGDLCWGPMPAETLDVIRGVPNARFVRGNADRSVAEGDEKGADQWVFEITSWCHDQLDPAARDFLVGQAPTQTATVAPHGDVLFVHGSPRSDTETITAATDEHRIIEMLAGVTQRLVVLGHTHAQFDRTVGDHRLINAGSVGLPFGEPGAYWAIIGEDIELRRTTYDFERAAQMFIGKGGPGAAGFADHALEPPPLETAARIWG